MKKYIVSVAIGCLLLPHISSASTTDGGPMQQVVDFVNPFWRQPALSDDFVFILKFNLSYHYSR